ncbi:MAG: ABC transporter permease [Candidatus Pristimantibacillus sp.]
MMFPNNNKVIINKLTNRTLRANKNRNLYVILAIALTTFLISAIFSVGMSYFKSYKLEQTRVMGTTAHAALTLPTNEQIEQMRSLPYLDTVGVQAFAGNVVNTAKMGNLSIDLFWFDTTEWQYHRSPSMTDIVGNYPVQANEIMISRWLLERMGIDNPELGMEVDLTYNLNHDDVVTEDKHATFILSGYYTEYMHIRAGNTGIMLVSQSFIEQTGMKADVAGSATVRFIKGADIVDSAEKLEQDTGISDRQNVKVVPLYETTAPANTAMVIGFAAIILFIMLSGYLLIYNVLYISVSKDIRYYGLLKTIGTTAKQIRSIVIGQVSRLSLIGIPLGLIVGALASLVIVPLALNLLTLPTGIEVSFNPWIFIGASFFALITTWISCIKPARKAGSISPIEAVRYNGVTIKSKRKKGTNGGKLYNMALRNVFRDRKRAAIVFLSLFMGITTFMSVNTIVLSLNFNNYIDSYIENDFTLYNNTVADVTSEDKRQKFTDELLTSIKSIPGITDVRSTFTEPVHLKYDPVLYEQHLNHFAKSHNITPPTNEMLMQQPNSFFSYAVGINSKYVEELNKTMANPIDVQAFERGDIALIATDSPELYQLGSEISLQQVDSNKQVTSKLGGFLPKNFQISKGGMAPNLYFSEQAMKQLVKEPLIERINIQSDDEQAATILAKLKALIGGDYDITLNSKLEESEAFAGMKLMLLILGGGMAVILAIIGILNFVNVMVTGVTVRRQEFAVMESIGMTKKQLITMLIYEGLNYAIIASALVVSFGSLITYGLFTLFQIQANYAVFTYPVLPMSLALVFIFVICMVVPVLSYKSASQQSVTERLRSTEG